MQDWLNRLGLTLQFLALWLVTPQIVGEDLMLKAGKSLSAMTKARTNFMRKTRKTLLYYGEGVKPTLRTGPGRRLISVTLVLYGPIVFTVILAFFVRPTEGTKGVVIALILFPFALVALLYLWFYPVLGLMSWFGWLITASTRSAHSLLIIGAIFFTAGFAVLLTATWIHT